MLTNRAILLSPSRLSDVISAAYRADAIRAAEAAMGPLLADGTLMRRAAAGLARTCLAELRARHVPIRGARVLLAAGPGNNGGDGLYAAARLAQRGADVSFWATGEGLHTGGAAALRSIGGHELDAVEALNALADADLVIDAVLGLGARGGLPAEVATFATAAADLGSLVVAVDLPSGLVPDMCTVSESFRADVTVTFGGARLAHVLEPARSRCGRIEVVDIGIELGTPEVRAWTLRDVVAVVAALRPDATSDKYSRGVVGIDAGSNEYIGAGILAATGAVYTGAGMVRFVGPKPGPVRLALPNVVTSDGRVQARVLGCGWGERPDARATIESALKDEVPVLLDADALRPEILTGLALRPDVLLTPHAGELARLLGCERVDVTADPLGAVVDAVEKYGCTVLLKGATQYVAGTDFPLTIAYPGPAWTAQAGSGDVLAGIIGTLLAAGLPTPKAALAGASLQALAAARIDAPCPPQDVVREVALLIGQLA